MDALGLAAVAVPVAVHLWQRRKVVVIPFGTLRYLRAAAARTSRSARLENLLLLLLRCAMLGLLALAAARPAVSRKGLQGGGSVTRTVVLLVDRSMSMGYRQGGRTRLDVAKEQAVAVLSGLRPGDEAAVFAVEDRADPVVAQPTQDRGVVRRAIDGIQGGEGGTDFSSGLVAARKLLAASTKPEREVYLFTDNQASGWRFDPRAVFDDAWRKAGAGLVVVRPDNAQAGNAAVARVAVTTPLAVAGARVSGVATVANLSALALHDVLTLGFVNGETVNIAVETAPRSTQDIPFELALPAYVSGKAARGTARLQGDNLPADDQYYFSVPIHEAPRCLIFEGAAAGPDRQHGGYYLRRALAAGVNHGSETAVLPADAIQDTDLGGYSAVFLADVPRLSDRAALRLDAYARGGGSIVYFPGGQTDLSALARLDFLPARALRLRELPGGRLSSQITEPGNPLFADAWNADTPFPPLPQHRLIEWQLKPDARALVLAGGSEAFVIAGDTGAGRVYVVNASPDRAWGDFPLSPAFLPLVQQIALQSTEHGRRPETYEVGQTVPASPLLPRDRPLVVTLPDGSTQGVPADRAALLDHAPRTGFYAAGAADQPATVTFDVNPPGGESDLTPVGEPALVRGVPHETVVGLDALRLWLAQSRGMLPLWPALLILAALVFAAESVVANLAARRRARGGAPPIRTGRLNRRRQGSPFRAGLTQSEEPEAAHAP